MRQIVLLLISILFFTVLSAQDEKMLLRPENGKEYIYEFTDSQYMLGKDEERLRPMIQKKILQIKFSKVQPENNELLQVITVKNTIEKLDEYPPQYLDYRFPDFKDGFYGRRYDNYYEELLCDTEFQYEFDQKTSSIDLYNRADILLDVREKLNRKDFNKTEIDRYTTEFNEKAIPLISKKVQSIYQVLNSEFENPDQSRYKISKERKDGIMTLNLDAFDENPGVYSKHIAVNKDENYLKLFNEIDIDTLKRNTYVGNQYSNKICTEKNIQLISSKNIQQNSLKISGEIENLKFRKITLYVLRRPFGTVMQQESVFLDENNKFNFDSRLNHPGLVFLKFGQDNRNEPPSVVPLYAEPGSNIHLEAKGNTFPWEINFSGDYSKATQMLYDFFISFDVSKTISENGLNLWYYRTSYQEYHKAAINLESFLEKFQDSMEEYVFCFISNELKALVEWGTTYYLGRAYQILNSNGRLVFPKQEDIDANWLEQNLGKYPMTDIYNDYGLYSRMLAESKWHFQYQAIKKTNADVYPKLETGIVFSNFWFFDDLPLQTEVAKTVLSGHPLYSQLANHFMSKKTRLLENSSQNDKYKKNKIDEYVDLMLRLCNNKEFSDALYQFNQNHLNWEDSAYVPEVEFFNGNAESVVLKDFLGEKTTIFYVTQNWGRERYYFDDLAKQNPDFNYVMINEGNNIQEWLDYLKRAEPVANQLFLVNTNIQLQDIFKNSFGHFIIYNKDGKRVSYAGNPLTATNLAKQFSKEPQKEPLNKSQLQIIILVLLTVLSILIVSFIYWKWQVRQRLRKEEQFRKLRELELTAIRSQMNPHFLFNSLNSVQNLVQQNMGREAHLYLSDFAGLIRKVLRNSEKEEVSLAEELEMTEQYLNLEKLRFDFEYHINVKSGIDQHNTMVPSMLLQPFVENSVIHGLQNKSGEKRINVEVFKNESGIKIFIEDNGIGRTAAKEISKNKNGKGTKLVKERLEVLQQKQGEKYQMEIIDLNGEKTGTRVEILIPEEI